ncbi:MAG: nucleotidyltransferase domain-containing protein [Phycisphaeraceae bacterium]|nr:nucleotidyltransferase domain-containing protein [Phycisphaeraceae bacterium]
MVAEQTIREYVGRLVERFHPKQVVLFGSYALGTATSDSDVDLLVVMPDGGDPPAVAGRIRATLPRSFPLDLIVRDPDVLSSRIERKDWFLREILEQGVILHEATDR